MQESEQTRQPLAAMNTIAVLDLASNEPFRRLSGFIAIAREFGCELRVWGPPYHAAALAEFIARSQGILVPTWTILTSDEAQAALRDAIRLGKHALIQFDPNERHEMNPLVEPFGIEVTSLRPTTAGHAMPMRWLTLKRSEEPRAFRAKDLFQGVDELTTGNPYHIRISGEAESVLAVPNREGMLVDTTTDYFRETNPDSVNTVVRSRLTDSKGEIVVSAASVWTDFAVPMAGNRTLCELNAQFVRNLIL